VAAFLTRLVEDLAEGEVDGLERGEESPARFGRQRGEDTVRRRADGNVADGDS